jgi:hypothetical protein
MGTYRLFLIGQTGSVVSERQYAAESDESALMVARKLLNTDQTMVGFELWQGSSRIALNALATRMQAARRLSNRTAQSKETL